MLRLLAFVLVAGCASQASTACPESYAGTTGDELEGQPCATSETCFVQNEFSSCASGFYRCVAGTWHFDRGLGARDGASCTDSPIASCSYEGNPGCSAPPSAEACSCASDGLWHCTCACHESSSTCGGCPESYYPELVGKECGPAGEVCPLDGHSCTCTDDGSGVARYQCT